MYCKYMKILSFYKRLSYFYCIFSERLFLFLTCFDVRLDLIRHSELWNCSIAHC